MIANDTISRSCARNRLLSDLAGATFQQFLAVMDHRFYILEKLIELDAPSVAGFVSHDNEDRDGVALVKWGVSLDVGEHRSLFALLSV